MWGQQGGYRTCSAGCQYPVFAAISCKHGTRGKTGIVVFRADLSDMVGSVRSHMPIDASVDHTEVRPVDARYPDGMHRSS
jgi:hypothetical protein